MQGKPGHREDGEVGGVGWQNGEWVWQRVHNDRFQCAVGVEESRYNNMLSALRLVGMPGSLILIE